MTGDDATGIRSGTHRWRIALLNGLNMTNLGRRDPHIYGRIESLDALERLVAEAGSRLGVDVIALHSNDEGALVDFAEAHDDIDGYLINPGGLWAYGEPTRIALAQTGKPVVEVHFANIRATGEASTFTKSVAGTAMGFRHHGYLGALVALTLHLDAAASPG